MATRLRIQRTTGGEVLEVYESALPFFPGYVVVGTVTGVPSFPIPGEIVVHGDDPDVTRPPTTGRVVWFGTVDPTNSDDTRDVWVPIAEGS